MWTKTTQGVQNGIKSRGPLWKKKHPTSKHQLQSNGILFVKQEYCVLFSEPNLKEVVSSRDTFSFHSSLCICYKTEKRAMLLLHK